MNNTQENISLGFSIRKDMVKNKLWGYRRRYSTISLETWVTHFRIHEHLISAITNKGYLDVKCYTRKINSS